MTVQAGTRRGMLRVLIISAAAAALPVSGAFLFPDALMNYEALMWLLLLVPAFLWSYERAWSGVATALAFGMAAISTTYALAQWAGHAIPDLLYGVVVAYVGITLGLGVFADRWARRTAAPDTSALTDPLTGLSNRLHADAHLEIEYAAAAAKTRPVCVVVFDVDRLSDYNERHGTEAGDNALRAFGLLLRRHTRRMNVSARYTDDSFVTILGDCVEEGALVFAARMLEQARAIELNPAAPTVSVGIAMYRATMSSAAELLQAAESALDDAKRDGRNRLRVYGRAASELAPPREAEKNVRVSPARLEGVAGYC